MLAAVHPDAARGGDAPQLVAPGTLTVCLPRNAGVIAGRRLTGGSGFDFDLSGHLAGAMGLALAVVWYESEPGEESTPLRETYAMLAYGLCDAVPGHPRYAPATGRTDYANASLPRWLGMPQEIDPATGLFRDVLAGFVDIRPIAVSDGYMRSEIGLVYREGTEEPTGLGDLGGRSLHLQQGTLSGAIAMVQTDPADRVRVTTHNPGAGFLWEVESGGGDLAIVDVAAYDAHRKASPFTTLRLAEWRHPIGMDVGVAVLAENEPLLARINAALAGLERATLEVMADAAGLTWTPPASEALMPELTARTLQEVR